MRDAIIRRALLMDRLLKAKLGDRDLMLVTASLLGFAAPLEELSALPLHSAIVRGLPVDDAPAGRVFIVVIVVRSVGRRSVRIVLRSSR